MDGTWRSDILRSYHPSDSSSISGFLPQVSAEDRSYDQIAQMFEGSEIIHNIVMTKMAYAQAVIPFIWIIGSLRMDADIFDCSTPDSDDPQWARDKEHNLTWTQCFITREDWYDQRFYRSSDIFQKHNNRQPRLLDIHTGKVDSDNAIYVIWLHKHVQNLVRHMSSSLAAGTERR